MQLERRTFVATLAIGVSSLFAGCSDSGAGGPPANQQRISANEWEPLVLTVEPGAEVEWLNQDPHPHTVTSQQLTDEGTEWEFDEYLSSQGSTTRTFEEEGIYQHFSDTPRGGKDKSCAAVIVRSKDSDMELEQSLPCE